MSEIPGREDFVEAAVGVLGVSEAEANRMYDLLTGPIESFTAAVAEWEATFGHAACNTNNHNNREVSP